MSYLFWIVVFASIPVLTLIIVAAIGIIHYWTVLLPVIQKGQKLDNSEINKNGFSAEKLRKLGKLDVVVIGSGMGGLTTAALLSRIGYKVLVLEQHDVAGGNTHTFEDHGYEFDTGLHYIGGEVGKKQSLLGFLFHMLTLGQLKWQPLSKTYDIAAISPLLATQDDDTFLNESDPIEIPFTEGPEGADTLTKLFPKEVENIRDHNRLMEWAADIVFPLYLGLKLLPLSLSQRITSLLSVFLNSILGATTAESISSCSKNSTLMGVLSYCWGDYGLPPGQSSFVMNALLTTHFAKGGSYYPIGGPSRIARTMIPLIEAAGGAVFVRAPVSCILFNEEGTEVRGVRVRGEHDVLVNTVVSACGVMNTFTQLIGEEQHCGLADRAKMCFSSKQPSDVVPDNEEVPASGGNDGVAAAAAVAENVVDNTPGWFPFRCSKLFQWEQVDLLRPSCTMFSVYIGLNKGPSEVQIPSTNKWLFPHWNHDEALLRYQNQTTIKAHLLAASNKNNRTADHLTSITVEQRLSDDYLPVVFIGSPSAKDPEWETKHPHRSVVEVITVGDFDGFDALEKKAASGRKVLPGNRGNKYETLKKRIQDKLVEVFKEQYPDLVDHIDYVTSGSPLSNKFYLGSKYGEVYGLAHTTSRFTNYEWLLRPQQQVKGLYLSGQDVACAGIAGALTGGAMCAVAINKLVVINLLISYVMEAMK